MWDGFCQSKYPLMLTKEMCNTVNVTCENIFNNKPLTITHNRTEIERPFSATKTLKLILYNFYRHIMLLVVTLTSVLLRLFFYMHRRAPKTVLRVRKIIIYEGLCSL